jgi:hypothetical protein
MSAIQHRPDFDQILQPHTAEEFIERYFEQQVLYIDRSEHRRDDPYAGFFPFAEMDRVIAHGDLQPDYTLTLVKGDVAIHKLGASGRQDYRGGHDIQKTSLEADNIYREVAQGATFRVSFTERTCEPIRRLAGDLERHLNANILTNVFLTPADSHAFSTHFDAHDVIILQLAGHKHWEVLEPPADLPMEKPVRVRPELFERRLPYDGRASLTAALGTEPRQYRLDAGDLLYVPRGFSHRAWAGDELSLHMTIEIRAFTWHELFAHAVMKAVPGSRLLRESLPPGFVAEPAAMAAILERRDELQAAAEEAISPERLEAAIHDLADRYLYTRTPLTGGRRDDAAGAGALRLDDRLEIRPGTTARLREEDGKLLLFFTGQLLELPARARPLVEQILERRSFAPRELEGELGEESRLTLCRHLLREGLLTRDVPGGAAAASSLSTSLVAIQAGG